MIDVSTAPGRLALLGPQVHVRTVPEIVREFGLADAPVATITAGWEERERDDADLDQDLGGRTRNLGLFPRAEDVFRRDKDLRAAMYRRYDGMNQQAALYRAQLAPLMSTLRQVERRMAQGEDQLAPERENCVRLLQELDAHRMRRVDELDAQVFTELHPTERQEVARHREEVRQILDGVGGVLIAGGHVGILLNRLRLFGVLDLIRGLPIIAWSAGAMVLTERVVLFHDHPPEGKGDPELHVRGLGVARGVVALPNASRRLNLGDDARVGAFAARFAGTP
ncbi:MAG: hypothetical protein R3F49_00025, partial [Planctomycetota bacterium]